MDFFTSGLFFGSTPGVRSRAPGFLEGVVSDVLQKVLGAFVRGLDRDHLEVSVWDGDVRLHGLELRTEVLDALNLPVRVLGGSLGEVRVSVPWRNLGSEPMVISVDSVLLLLVARADEAEGPAAEAEAEGKRAIAEVVDGVEQQQAAQEEMGPSLVDRLVQSLLQKLQVSVTNVHVRVLSGPEEEAIAGGVMLRSLKLDELPEDDAAARPDVTGSAQQRAADILKLLSRKRVAVEGLSAYLDTAPTLGRGGSGSTGQSVGAGPPSGAPSASAATPMVAEAVRGAAAAAGAAPTRAVGAPSASGASAGGSGAPPDANGSGASSGEGAIGAPAGWELQMLAMIVAPAGPSTVLRPVDLVVGACFDLSGHVLAATPDVPRFRLTLDVSTELALTLSHGQVG